MITPKEKAKELVDKYSTYVVMWTGGIEVETQNVKQCALITVEEILKTRPGFPYPDELELEIKGIFNIINYPIVYWQEVKKEIEKL